MAFDGKFLQDLTGKRFEEVSVLFKLAHCRVAEQLVVVLLMLRAVKVLPPLWKEE